MLKHILKVSHPVLSLPRYAKRIIALSVDIGLFINRLAGVLSAHGRVRDFIGVAFWAVAIAVVIALPIFVSPACIVYLPLLRCSGNVCGSTRHRSIWLLYASVITAVGVAGVPLSRINPAAITIFRHRQLACLFLLVWNLPKTADFRIAKHWSMGLAVPVGSLCQHWKIVLKPGRRVYR